MNMCAVAVKKPTVGQLHRKLQPIFNRYIRLRDSWVDDNGRVGKCISCDRVIPIELSNAGHFVPASYYYLRYNEQNVNLQCVSCNKWRHGNPFGYMLGLAELYDKSVPYELSEKMGWANPHTVQSLTEAIEYYKGKVEEME